MDARDCDANPDAVFLMYIKRISALYIVHVLIVPHTASNPGCLHARRNFLIRHKGEIARRNIHKENSTLNETAVGRSSGAFYTVLEKIDKTN